MEAEDAPLFGGAAQATPLAGTVPVADGSRAGVPFGSYTAS
jgi:hypothetical protein